MGNIQSEKEVFRVDMGERKTGQDRHDCVVGEITRTSTSTREWISRFERWGGRAAQSRWRAVRHLLIGRQEGYDSTVGVETKEAVVCDCMLVSTTRDKLLAYSYA